MNFNYTKTEIKKHKSQVEHYNLKITQFWIFIILGSSILKSKLCYSNLLPLGDVLSGNFMERIIQNSGIARDI